METIIILFITLGVVMSHNGIKKSCPKLSQIIESSTPSWNISIDIV